MSGEVVKALREAESAAAKALVEASRRIEIAKAEVKTSKAAFGRAMREWSVARCALDREKALRARVDAAPQGGGRG